MYTYSVKFTTGNISNGRKTSKTLKQWHTACIPDVIDKNKLEQSSKKLILAHRQK